jgi:hypothetical protein
VEALMNNLKSLREVGGSNSKYGSNEKLRDNEDPKKESKKYLEKEKPSSSVITPSQPLFKMKVKVYIKKYQGDIDVVKLNN